jgi:hypothetical protein
MLGKYPRAKLDQYDAAEGEDSRSRAPSTAPELRHTIYGNRSIVCENWRTGLHRLCANSFTCRGAPPLSTQPTGADSLELRRSAPRLVVEPVSCHRQDRQCVVPARNFTPLPLELNAQGLVPLSNVHMMFVVLV